MPGAKTVAGGCLLFAAEVSGSEAQVPQNSGQSAFRDVASGAGDGSKPLVLGVPPDFVRAGSLPHEFAPQPAQLLGQLAIGHRATRSSAW